MAFRLPSVLASLAALFGGLAVGYLDRHTTEEVVTLALIFALNLVLAAIRLSGAWRYPIITALAAAGRIWLDAGPRNPRLPQTLASFAALSGILFVAGALGSGAILTVRRLSARVS